MRIISGQLRSFSLLAGITSPLMGLVLVLTISGCKLPDAVPGCDSKGNSSEENPHCAPSPSPVACQPADVTVTFKDKSGNVYPNLDLQMRKGAPTASYTTTAVKTNALGRIVLSQISCDEFDFRIGTSNGIEVSSYASAFLSDTIYALQFAGFTRTVSVTSYNVILPKILYSDASSPSSPSAFGDSCLWQGNESLGTPVGTMTSACFRSGSHYVAQAINVGENVSACGIGMGLYGTNINPVNKILIYDNNAGVPGNLLYQRTPDSSLNEGAYTSYGAKGSYLDLCKNGVTAINFVAGQTYWIVAYYSTTPSGVFARVKPGLANSGLIPIESSDGVHWQRAFLGYASENLLVPSLTESVATLNAFKAGTLVPDDFALEVFLVE